MFGHDICLKGRLDTFSTFSAFKIHNSVSLWVKITRKPNSIGRPFLCLARKQSRNSATGCDVINRWIIDIRNKYQALLESCPPPCLEQTPLNHLDDHASPTNQSSWVLTFYTFDGVSLTSINKELKQRRRRRQRQRQRQRKRQKCNRFGLAKQQLCTSVTLFCTFLSRRCTTTT